MSGWIVGRGDEGCFVEQGEPPLGEASFDSEAEAVEYAIACEVDAIEPLRANLKALRSRLRRIDRAALAQPTNQERS